MATEPEDGPVLRKQRTDHQEDDGDRDHEYAGELDVVGNRGGDRGSEKPRNRALPAKTPQGEGASEHHERQRHVTLHQGRVRKEVGIERVERGGHHSGDGPREGPPPDPDRGAQQDPEGDKHQARSIDERDGILATLVVGVGPERI